MVATTSAVVVSVEEAGCTQAAESEGVVVVFGAAAAEAHVVVAAVGIVVPYRREAPSH